METYHLRPYFCTECARRFTTKLFLKRHFAVHSSNRNFKCDLCLSTYKYKKGLNRHIKKFHPDHYSSLNLTSFKRHPKVKFQENAEPIFKVRKKTADGYIEEIPPVVPSHEEPEMKLKNHKNLLNYFIENLKKQGKNYQSKKLEEFSGVPEDSSKPGLSSDIDFELSQKREEKFVDGEKGVQLNPHKKIENLEDVMKKCKLRERELSLELEMEMVRQVKLEKVLKRLKHLYRLRKLVKKMRVENRMNGIYCVRVKIEED